MYNKEDLINDIKNASIKENDTLMIHSSFSSIKNIEGGAKTVLEAFKESLKDGLLILPTHTWASVRNDKDIMDKKLPNSCVGYLTNQAILDKDFVRSNHPTHSVVAYGKNSLDYIKDDDYAKTPVSPLCAHGKLKNNGKILFIGAPLSKITFVHSIEEEYNVEDRFTDHIYTFYTKKEDGSLLEFKMPRHYSTKHAHLSENYAKLLPVMLKKGIAKEVKILDTTSILVDASSLYKMVSKILDCDIHAFDDERDVEIYA